jgi:hypothetical protein
MLLNCNIFKRQVESTIDKRTIAGETHNSLSLQPPIVSGSKLGRPIRLVLPIGTKDGATMFSPGWCYQSRLNIFFLFFIVCCCLHIDFKSNSTTKIIHIHKNITKSSTNSTKKSSTFTKSSTNSQKHLKIVHEVISQNHHKFTSLYFTQNRWKRRRRLR